MIDRRKFGSAALAAATLGLPKLAAAQLYPSRPIRIVVGYTAGTGLDILLRTVADRLQARLGQPVIIDNKPGAATVLSVEYVMRQPPDGYTLVVNSPTLASARFVMAKVPFHLTRDFTYIAPVTVVPMALMVRSALGVNTPQELVRLLKSKPGQLQYGSYGTGAANHLKMEWFLKGVGATALHVPYKDNSQFVTGMMRGDVDFSFSAPSALSAGVQNGSVKAIAMSTPTRSASYPDVPTLAETVLSGFEYTTWFGLAGPARMPSDVVDRLTREINQVMKDPAVQKKLAELNFDPASGDGALLMKWMTDTEKVYQDALDAGLIGKPN